MKTQIWDLKLERVSAWIRVLTSQTFHPTVPSRLAFSPQPVVAFIFVRRYVQECFLPCFGNVLQTLKYQTQRVMFIRQSTSLRGGNMRSWKCIIKLLFHNLYDTFSWLDNQWHETTNLGFELYCLLSIWKWTVLSVILKVIFYKAQLGSTKKETLWVFQFKNLTGW